MQLRHSLLLMGPHPEAFPGIRVIGREEEALGMAKEWEDRRHAI